MKLWRIAFVMLAAFSLASCSSDDASLFPTLLVQTTLRLSLHHLPCIIDGFSMPH